MASMRVIVFQEHEFWYAQGLEHDICVRAKDLRTLQNRFEIAVRLESEESGGIERIEPAPKRFQKMWDFKSGDFKSESANSDIFDYGIAA